MATKESNDPTDSLPAYVLPLPAELDQKNPTLKGDGRLDVDLNSSIVKYVSFIHRRSTIVSLYGVPEGKDDLDSLPPPYTEFQAAEPPPFPVKLNIVIQVVGSRGDVQPFIALGNELQKHGHRVRLATHNVFDSFVRKSGLEFFPIGGDPTELMAYMVRNPGLIPSMKSLRAGEIQKKRKMMAEILNGCWQSCIEPDPISAAPFVADAIIANPPSFGHIHCAQALSIPVHLMFTMPWSKTTHFPHPLANIKSGSNSLIEPEVVNPLSYLVVEFLTWQGLGDIINEWRDTLDLEQISFSDGPNLAEILRVPFTYCWSPALVPKPTDWGSHIDVCGFFFREPPDYTPPADLAQFIEAGPPPIYIGFGSIVIDDPQKMTSILLEAIQKTGVRALVSRGWSNLGGPEVENVMYLDDCPHEWLFQNVAAVIHHGGAGTTACGLLNGRPTTIVPFFGDQPFWGEMVAAAGAGPRPIPQASLNVDNLVEAIQLCLTPEAREAAQGIAAKMRTENGVKAAVASFHANLPVRELQCDIIKGQPAAWMYHGKKTKLRLSKVAVEILASHLRINDKRLKKNESRQIIIETRRWDPITGTVSAAIGVSHDIMKAVTGVVVKPARAYRNQSKASSSEPSTEEPVRMSDIKAGLPGETGGYAAPVKKEKPRDCVSMTTSVSAASVKGVTGVFKSYASGLVTIPYAFTEGFRNIPHLYGEEVRDIGTISDWKSGTAAGAKVVVYGIIDGVSDVVVLPYKGAQREGAIGGVKGVGKGLAGLSSKLFAAAVGMAAYPLQGIYKSIWATVKPNTQRSITLARHAEGSYLYEQIRAAGFDDQAVMDLFTTMSHGGLSNGPLYLPELGVGKW
ncbi:glycosyltransferase family 1 protein [Annulohypoxylon bovei var. microspora]|nr:glycosyltransferase family 1 protein [Annulohypoxylon bovei var. microspora]